MGVPLGTIRAQYGASTAGSNVRHRGGIIRKVTLGVLGAAAAVASLLLIRQNKLVPPKETLDVPAGETVPGNISLERLRELGI